MTKVNQKTETHKTLEERILRVEHRATELKSEKESNTEWLAEFRKKYAVRKNQIDRMQAEFDSKYPGFYKSAYEAAVTNPFKL